MGLMMGNPKRALRLRESEGCWCIEKRGLRRFFGMLPGHWHAIEFFRSPVLAMLHLRRVQKATIKDRFE